MNLTTNQKTVLIAMEITGAVPSDEAHSAQNWDLTKTAGYPYGTARQIAGTLPSAVQVEGRLTAYGCTLAIQLSSDPALKREADQWMI